MRDFREGCIWKVFKMDVMALTLDGKLPRDQKILSVDRKFGCKGPKLLQGVSAFSKTVCTSRKMECRLIRDMYQFNRLFRVLSMCLSS